MNKNNLVIVLLLIVGALCVMVKCQQPNEPVLNQPVINNNNNPPPNPLSETKKDLTYLDKRVDEKPNALPDAPEAIGRNPHNSKEDSSSREDIDDELKEEIHKHKTQALGFLHALFASLSVIVVSEIGDKTFFIAAIMAMKHPRLTVYTGAMFALGLMTLLSALLGNILTKLIPKTYTYYASSVLFGLFGVKMLHEGWHMDNSDASEEYEEANTTLKENEEKNFDGKDVEANESTNSSSDLRYPFNSRRFVIVFRKYFSAVFLQAFILTFLAEWGDRSQISTIILGARENMVGTVLGGTLGHAICTGFAVIGGRMIAQRISVRTVTLVGAFVFLFFAFSAFFIDPNAY